MRVLITGTAGFIGYHLVKRLAPKGVTITGIDSINDYYDTSLKYDRLADTGIDRDAETFGKPVQSSIWKNYTFIRMKLEDRTAIDTLFREGRFDVVVNLAAQAGVRYSIENPYAYVDSNLAGFMNVLEGCRHTGVGHLVYASSSSVYGMNTAMPFSTSDRVDHPVSLYAATKKANELMAHTYSYLYNLPTTGLRFFTVYGPWGRPDMAPILFANAISKGETIKVFNHGQMKRDFTFIDDIVEGIERVMMHIPANNPDFTPELGDPSTSRAPYKIYNIGNNTPAGLLEFIGELEKALGREAVKDLQPMQPGDVVATWANVDDLTRDVGYKPDTSLGDGIARFAAWFKDYYKI